MIFQKRSSETGLVVTLNEDDKTLRLSCGRDGDLYWSIFSINGDNTFTITKENYGVYELFDKLFDDIKNINLFPFNFMTEDEKNEDLQKIKQEMEERKLQYRFNNRSHYNELYDKDNQVITWYSDETQHKVANVLRIKKTEEEFLVEFGIQPTKKGYEEDLHLQDYIPVRFCNSGSYYSPFNVAFMRMYADMRNVEDINEIGHQIHMEEYLYAKEKKLVRSKNN